MSLISFIDAAYHFLINENYVFGIAALSHSNYWATCVVIFISTFTGRVFFPVFISIIFVLSIFQIIVFEYFGSYILPVHYIQLLPDFLLIMESLVEATHEIVPIFAMSGLLLLVVFLVLVPLARTRVIHAKAIILLFAIIGSDTVGKYLFIALNKEKLGEPSFKLLFPNVNTLGVFNAYKSARYLAVGILPDRLAGNVIDYPPLPEPALIASPDANIILIINESVRAHSMSVLGYRLKTTPNFDSIPELYATRVFSSGTMTRTSFAGLLHRLKHPGIGEQFLSQSNCLFRLAQTNGFDTHFIYSQDREIVDTLLPFMCSDYITSIRASSDAPEAVQGFDESLAYHLRNIDLTRNNFIVIGPNGAHSPYAEKSPAAFKKFELEYDNAIHYSDHVVAQLIQHLRFHSSKPTYILYTSDHGQLLKGEDTRRGHGWFKGRVVQVPFLFLSYNDPKPNETMAKVRNVQSHFDISTLVVNILGYDVAVDDASDKEIFINGSDLSGLAGQMRLHLVQGKLQSVEVTNSADAPPKLDEFELSNSAVQPGPTP